MIEDDAHPACPMCGHPMTFDHVDETSPTEPIAVFVCTCGYQLKRYPPATEGA